MQKFKKFMPELSVINRVAVPVKETEGYEIYSGYLGKRLRVLGKLDGRMIESIRRERVADIEMLPFAVKSDLDLGLLGLLPGLRAVSIHADRPIDWTPLQRLTQLRHLSLRTGGRRPQTMDFTRFRQLHTCTLTWHAEWDSILKAKTLRGLTFENSTHIPEFDLRSLSKLRELFLTECRGLRAVRCAPRAALESVGIASCRSFETLLPGKQLDGLKYFSLAGPSRFDIELIGRCRDLRKLWLNGVGRLRSLRFLSKCTRLEWLLMHFSTYVEDGDMSVLAKLPRLKLVTYRNHRHYSHRWQDLNRNPRTKRELVSHPNI